MMTSKSSTVTSINSFGRLVPALLTRIWNGSALPMAACIAGRSVTSRVSAAACCPRARIASAASSISFLVRAARVTCAPASASAAAAVSPMPRPAPVTSARLPSRRKEDVGVRSIIALSMVIAGLDPAIPLRKARFRFGCRDHRVTALRAGPVMTPKRVSLRRLPVRHVAAAVTAHAHIGLLSVRDKAFQHAEPRADFADLGARLVGQHLLIGAGLDELADPQPAGEARVLLGRQRVVGADHLVAVGDIGAWPEKQRAIIFHVGEEVVG